MFVHKIYPYILLQNNFFSSPIVVWVLRNVNNVSQELCQFYTPVTLVLYSEYMQVYVISVCFLAIYLALGDLFTTLESACYWSGPKDIAKLPKRV